MVDGKGLPLAVHLTPGQRHESTCFETLMNQLHIPQAQGRPRTRPGSVGADKAYSIPRIRSWLRKRGIQAVIPQKSDELARHRGRPLKFDKTAYRHRNIIERRIGWLKECRRLGTRYDKLAVSYLSMVKLACIRTYLPIAFSDRA